MFKPVHIIRRSFKVQNDKNDLLKKLKNRRREIISSKYQSHNDVYYIKIVDELIYNDRSYIVAKFKDFLILEDVTEFLKRFYNLEESRSRLKKICEFYENFSKIFPNYTVFYQSKYIYKNIKRKQKLIDNNDNENNNEKLEESKFFHTETYNSICTNKIKPFDEASWMSFEKIITNINTAENDVDNTEKNKLKIICSSNFENFQILLSSDCKKKTNKIELGKKKIINQFDSNEIRRANIEKFAKCKLPVPNLITNEKVKIQINIKPPNSARDHKGSEVKLLDSNSNTSPNLIKGRNQKFSSNEMIGNTPKKSISSKEPLLFNRINDNKYQTFSQKSSVKKVNVVNIDLNKQNTYKHKISMLPKLNLEKIVDNENVEKFANDNLQKKCVTERLKNKIEIGKESSNLCSKSNSKKKIEIKNVKDNDEKNLPCNIEPLNLNANDPSSNKKIHQFKTSNSIKSNITKVTDLFKSFKGDIAKDSSKINKIPLTTRNTTNLQNNKIMSEKLFSRNTSSKNVYIMNKVVYKNKGE